MATLGNQLSSTLAARSEPGRRSIELDVAGGGLLLRGRFSDWESGLTLGPDLDKAGVRLAIDATSAAGAADEEDPLFTFHSRTVEPADDGTFVARGTFTRSAVSKAVEMTVETPPGHTALFVLSFAADKSDKRVVE